MDLTKLKADHPDLYKEVFAQGAVSGKASAESTFLQERDAMDTQFSEMGERIAKFEKAEVIRSEKELRHDAESVFSAKLAKSDIPVHLHEKVLPHVIYAKFVENGVLDVAKFSEAIDTEIKSWQDAGISNSVMGSGFSADNVIADEAEKATKLAEDIDTSVDSLLSVVQTA